MSFCPTKDIHSVYLDGELPEIYKAEYEQHIQNCEKCRKQLEQLKALRSMFKADSDSLNLDSHFMDESFQRLQVKMAYSRNVGKLPQKSPFKIISYVASGVAAAAVLALVIPAGLKSNKASASAAVAATNQTVSNIVNSVTNTVTALPVSTNSATNVSLNNKNVSFDSGRSVVVSGNIQDVVLASKNQKGNTASFAKNVNDVDVLRPDFMEDAISIKITVPGMGDIPVTAEINLPMELTSGRR